MSLIQTMGIDLDDTTINMIDPLCRFAQSKGIPLFYERIKNYDFWTAWGGTREEAIALVEEFYRSDEIKKAPPVGGAIKSIKSLAEKSRLVFITSRFGDGKIRAEEWLSEHLQNIPYKLFFAGHYAEGNVSKPNICAEQEVDVIVDDFHEYVRGCVEANSRLRGVLFGNYGWTRQIEHPRVVHAHSWQDVLRFVNTKDN